MGVVVLTVGEFAGKILEVFGIYELISICIKRIIHARDA
jgi:hypothetical protein